jgi:hypothetical protein
MWRVLAFPTSKPTDAERPLGKAKAGMALQLGAASREKRPTVPDYCHLCKPFVGPARTRTAQRQGSPPATATSIGMPRRRAERWRRAGRGCTNPRFLHLGTSWKWVVSFTPLPLSPMENNPQYTLERPQGPSALYGEGEILHPTGNQTLISRSSWPLTSNSVEVKKTRTLST